LKDIRAKEVQTPNARNFFDWHLSALPEYFAICP
jgi:hypothetical protein